MNETYTVKKGDTLWGISNQYGVSVMELANLNNVSANTIKVGQVLTIPSKEGSNPNAMFMYTVKKGDTLYNIASIYNTTVDEIKKLNNLTNNNLQIGQVLRIPEMYSQEEMVMPSFKNYIVKKGDTLYKIALENDISVDEIKKDNSLTSDILQVGQILKIRTNEEVEECFGDNYNPDKITYIVKRGDNLYSIAKKYNTTVDAVKKKNNLKSNILSIGQELII